MRIYTFYPGVTEYDNIAQEVLGKADPDEAKANHVVYTYICMCLLPQEVCTNMHQHNACCCISTFYGSYTTTPLVPQDCSCRAYIPFHPFLTTTHVAVAHMTHLALKCILMPMAFLLLLCHMQTS